MSEQQQNSGGEQPQGDSPPVSFRDRAMNRLETESRPHRDDANFDGPPSNLNQADLPEQDAPQDAHQPDIEPIEDSLDPIFNEDGEQPKGDIGDGVDTPNVEDVSEDVDVPALRQLLEDSDAKLQSFQADYTQKTQKLGAARRELTTDANKAKQVAEMYVKRANHNLQRYENVNWQQLQSTLEPQAYNQRVAEYRQVVGGRDQAMREHEQIVNWADEAIEKQKAEQAEDSREILSKTIDDWGNELYAKLRDFSVETLNFSQEEFDALTDHRIINLIHGNWQMSNTGKTLRSIQQHGNQTRPPGGPNKGRPVPGGQSRKIQETHERNPGNRQASRNFFEDKLRRERTGR